MRRVPDGSPRTRPASASMGTCLRQLSMTAAATRAAPIRSACDSELTRRLCGPSVKGLKGMRESQHAAQGAENGHGAGTGSCGSCHCCCGA